MKKLKIFGISPWPSFWLIGNKGGTPSEYFVQKGFVDAGHEVYYFSTTNKDEIIDGGIHIYGIITPLSSIQSSNKILNYMTQVISWILFNLFATIKVLKISRKIKPDIIYAHSTYPVPAAYIVSKILKIPNIRRLYGTFLYSSLPDRFFLLRHFNEVLAYKLPFEYMIMTNDGTRSDVVAEKLGVPKEKLKFWMNGVNKDMYDPNFNKAHFKEKLGILANTKIILAVSRLEKWKHVERTIEAAPYIVSKYKDVIFLIVGDGCEKTNLEKLSEELGVKNYVKFMGAVPYDDVKSYMNAADIFVSLYDVSNVGNPLLEAEVCGKCIVTLNSGATGEIIKNGYNGILLEYKDLKDLTRVIIDLLNNDNFREKLGKNARKYALEHFQTWDERVRMEVELIEKVAMEGN